MNPIDITEEESKINSIASKAYHNGYGRGFGTATHCLLTLPFESLTEEFITNLIIAERGKSGSFRSLYKAVESTYTNKRGKTHICWRSIWGTYLKPKKADETEYIYVGYGNWDDDKHYILFTRERFELVQKYKCFGAFVVEKPEPEPETESKTEPVTETPPQEFRIKTTKRRLKLKMKMKK